MRRLTRTPSRSGSDTDALAKWYCETFGFTVAYKNDKEPPTYFVKLGESLIELIAASDSARQSRENTDPEGNLLQVIQRPERL